MDGNRVYVSYGYCNPDVRIVIAVVYNEANVFGHNDCIDYWNDYLCNRTDFSDILIRPLFAGRGDGIINTNYIYYISSHLPATSQRSSDGDCWIGDHVRACYWADVVRNYRGTFGMALSIHHRNSICFIFDWFCL